MGFHATSLGAPFLDALMDGLAELEAGPTPAILVPSRGAAAALDRAIRDRSADLASQTIVIPLDEVEPEDLRRLGIAEAVEPVPELLAPLRRQLLLARLVREWSVRRADHEPMSAGQAARLAESLIRLIDELQDERLDLSALARVNPDRYAAHRRVTLDFLDVLCEHWPRILAAEQGIEPVERRNLLIDSIARYWRANPPAGRVVAAGFLSVGAATVGLLRTIAGLPDGIVLMPGLDFDLDEPTWQAVGPTHPQYGLKRLLARLELDRAAVGRWPARNFSPSARARFVAEILRPAETTDRWNASLVELGSQAELALGGCARVEAPTGRDEAAVIALMLRSRLERPAGTAALVTPDRALARRVAAELRRWGILVPATAGEPLGSSPAGLFLRLLVRAAAAEFTPVPLLSLLKHPLCRGGLSSQAFARQVRALERAVLRGPAPAPGLDGIARALVLAGADKDLAVWFDNLADRLRPFARMMAGEPAELDMLIAQHRAAAEALMTGDAPAAAPWAGAPMLAVFLEELQAAAPGTGALDGPSYAELFEMLIAVPLATVAEPHPRLAVFGLDEAAFRRADLMVLAGLNEGVWPEPAQADPWLNRPMRLALGLAAPEEGIGRAAAIFAQAACAPEAIFTRARKAGGAPTIPSRWMIRLGMLAKGLGAEHRLDPGEPWLHWVDALDEPAQVAPASPPRPSPPTLSRPSRLSAAEVETLFRDPYAIYARHVLKLRPLEPIDADPGAAERGQLIHRALERFVRDHPEGLPADAYDRLIAAGRAFFDDEAAAPAVAAFWWPRFLRLARWFVDAFEPECRSNGAPIALDQSGSCSFALSSGRTFTLTGKVDRIDRRGDGSLAIYDYTTGHPPALDQARSNFSPRLTLDALIAAAGGYAGVPASEIGVLAHVVLTGAEQAGAFQPGAEAPGEVLARTKSALMRLLDRFDDPAMPYLARPRPELARAGAYDHLARLGEWGQPAEGEG